MARARRDGRTPSEIWPGFVDALSTLLLVTIFLLFVFVLAQFFLGQLLQGQDERLVIMQRELAAAESDLEGERLRLDDMRRTLAQLNTELGLVRSERDSAESELAGVLEERADLNARLARLLQDSDRLEQALRAAEEDDAEALAERQAVERELLEAERRIEAERETVEAQLAQLVLLRQEIATLTEVRDRLRDDLGAQDAALASSEAASEALRAELAETREQLGRIETLLSEREDLIAAQDVRIDDLDARLTQALAQEVDELQQFRSDFFGRLRAVLGERQGVRIVGDRFVFQSEVLFDRGAATLGADAQAQLGDLAATLSDITADLPDDLPWILQINGHTDRRPISTFRFPSNWELSAARAISVARFLTDAGIPAERVAAAGFAEFQPVDPGDTEDAYRRNRRIEVKLTTR